MSWLILKNTSVVDTIIENLSTSDYFTASKTSDDL